MVSSTGTRRSVDTRWRYFRTLRSFLDVNLTNNIKLYYGLSKVISNFRSLFQIATRDGVGGRCKLYIKEYQHRIFPRHKDKRFVSLYASNLDCQATSNHHAHLSTVIFRGADIVLQTINKQCLREVWRSLTLWFLSYCRFRFLTTSTHLVILVTCQWKLDKIQNCKLVWTLLYNH